MQKIRTCKNVLCSGTFTAPEHEKPEYCSKRCEALDNKNR